MPGLLDDLWGYGQGLLGMGVGDQLSMPEMPMGSNDPMAGLGQAPGPLPGSNMGALALLGLGAGLLKASGGGRGPQPSALGALGSGTEDAMRFAQMGQQMGYQNRQLAMQQRAQDAMAQDRLAQIPLRKAQTAEALANVDKQQRTRDLLDSIAAWTRGHPGQAIPADMQLQADPAAFVSSQVKANAPITPYEQAGLNLKGQEIAAQRENAAANRALRVTWGQMSPVEVQRRGLPAGVWLQSSMGDVKPAAGEGIVARDQKIAMLEPRVGKQMAADIVDGHVKIQQSQDGRTIGVNTIDGTTTDLTPQLAAAGAELPGPSAGEPTPVGPTIGYATGLAPRVMKEVGGTFGQIFPDLVSPTVERASKAYDSLEQRLTSALTMSSRPSNLTAKMVADLMPSQSIFASAEQGRQALNEMRPRIKQEYDRLNKLSMSPSIDKAQRGEVMIKLGELGNIYKDLDTTAPLPAKGGGITPEAAARVPKSDAYRYDPATKSFVAQ